jgi:hypothetical protein
MSMSTCLAGAARVTGGLTEELGAALADADGPDEVDGVDGAALGAERLGDDAAGFGRATWPVARAGRVPCGTAAVAVPMPMGLASAQTPAAAPAPAPAREESHTPSVCSAVTVPRAGGAAAEPGPRVR